jgi:FAD/FMN-containing dehydrogenase
MGRLERKHGYTIDNLLSVDLVTADGTVHHVSAEADPELFWGLRGAGANFGIATMFEFRLHPIGPNVTTAVTVFPIARPGRPPRCTGTSHDPRRTTCTSG